MDQNNFKKFKSGKNLKVPESISLMSKKVSKKDISFSKMIKDVHLSGIEEKFIAITFMMSNSDRDDNQEIRPRYADVSEVLDIPVQTLRNWWDNKGKIRKLVDTVNYELADFVKYKMMIELIRLLDSFGGEDYAQMAINDRTKLFDKFMAKLTEMEKIYLLNKEGKNKKTTLDKIGLIIPATEDMGE